MKALTPCPRRVWERDFPVCHPDGALAALGAWACTPTGEECPEPGPVSPDMDPAQCPRLMLTGLRCPLCGGHLWADDDGGGYVCGNPAHGDRGTEGAWPSLEAVEADRVTAPRRQLELFFSINLDLGASIVAHAIVGGEGEGARLALEKMEAQSC